MGPAIEIGRLRHEDDLRASLPRLADVLGEMLIGARDALAKGDRKLIAETRRLDIVLDRLNTAIKSYLTSLDPDELSESDHRRLSEIMTFDVVDRNLLPHTAKRLRRGLAPISSP